MGNTDHMDYLEQLGVEASHFFEVDKVPMRSILDMARDHGFFDFLAIRYFLKIIQDENSSGNGLLQVWKYSKNC